MEKVNFADKKGDSDIKKAIAELTGKMNHRTLAIWATDCAEHVLSYFEEQYPKYFLEEPIADLAREAGLSRSAIDNRLWRAWQALKALINENGEVHDHGHEAL